MGKPTTGASSGRLGGRLSGASRLKAKAKSAPQFTVINKLKKKQKKKVKARAAGGGGSSGADAVSAIAESIADALGLTPTRAGLAQLAALAGYAAGFAAGSSQSPIVTAEQQQQQQQQYPRTFAAPEAASASGASDERVPQRRSSRNQPLVETPAPSMAKRLKQAAGSGSSSSSSIAIEKPRRGDTYEVQAKASYGARKTYDFSEIVAIAKQLESGKLQKADLDKRDKDGNLLYKVPRTTMTDWLKDDAVLMAEKGKRGVKGSPHWRVELEVRGRKCLSKPGPGCVLGESVEDKLMLTISEAALKGWQ